MEPVTCGIHEELHSLSELANEKVQQELSRAVKNQMEESDLRNIMLQKADGHLHSQECVMTPEAGAGEVTSATDRCSKESTHLALLDEIDNAEKREEDKEKPSKKSSTLTRMLKGLRGEKIDDGSVKQSTGTLSRVFQNLNPVPKSNLDNISRAFHRIGDALHRKDIEDGPGRSKTKTLDRKESQSDKTNASGGKLGKLLKFRSSSEEDK